MSFFKGIKEYFGDSGDEDELSEEQFEENDSESGSAKTSRLTRSKTVSTRETPEKPAATQKTPEKPAATQETPKKPVATRGMPKKPAATSEKRVAMREMPARKSKQATSGKKATPPVASGKQVENAKRGIDGPDKEEIGRALLPLSCF